MPDANTQEFKIQIISTADNSGFRSAANAGQDLAKETEKGTAVTKEAAKAQDTAKESTEKLGHGMNQARLRGELFRRVMMSIGAYTPGLEYAVTGGASAFGALTAAAIGGGIALEKLIAYFQSFDEELASVTNGEMKDHEAAIKRLKTSWDEAQTALGNYYADLESAGKDSDPIKKQIDNIKAVTAAQIDSTEKIVTALGKQEVAYLRAHGASPDQISAAEARTQGQLSGLESQKEFGLGAGALEEELKMRQAMDAALQRKANAAIAAASNATAAKASADDELKKQRDLLDPTTEAGKKFAADKAAANAELAKGNEMMPYTYDAYGGKYPTQKKEIIAAAQAKLDDLNSQESRIKKRVSELEHEEFQKSEAAKAAQNASDAATSASTINRGRIRTLPGEIDQANKVQSATDAGRASLDIINSSSNRTNQTFGEMAAALHLSEAQKEKLLRGILDHLYTTSQVMRGFEIKLAQIGAQVKYVSRRP